MRNSLAIAAPGNPKLKTTHQNLPAATAECLREFYQAALAVQSAYNAAGPGRVEQQLWPPVAAAQQSVSASLSDCDTDSSELLQTVEDVSNLCSRCVLRSEGLCFITGEAGLIPRQDLVDRFERQLQQIQHWITEADRDRT